MDVPHTISTNLRKNMKQSNGSQRMQVSVTHSGAVRIWNWDRTSGKKRRKFLSCLPLFAPCPTESAPW